ncbi:MAG: hypothetical protein POELPBGB_00761 [Bacteroidia bacterium]|nr:hypothetical protein [Bacteroidia bacterium]
MNIATLDDLNTMKEEILSQLNKLSEKIAMRKADDEWLTTEEVKQRYKVKSTTTISKLLKPSKMGGKNIFKKSEIEQMLAAKK